MSIKHKHLKKSQLWRREGKWENSVKGGEKSYSTLLWRMSGEDSKLGEMNGKREREQNGEQLPSSAMEDEWRRQQIRRGKNGKWVREQDGEQLHDRLWRISGDESKLGGNNGKREREGERIEEGGTRFQPVFFPFHLDG